MADHNSIPNPSTRSAPSRGPKHTPRSSHTFAIAAGAAIGALAISTLYNRERAKQAERNNPPAGRFIEIRGVHLHYVERGTGEPLVLLHGNGSMVQDFESSGLIGMAAKKYRVIAFDRPGFGHSERPRSTIWTPRPKPTLSMRH